MRSHPRYSLFRFTIALAMAAAARLDAQLAKNSPFVPPQGAATAGPTAGAPLEFRGWLKTAEGILYRIRDPARKADTWVKLNERDSTLEVTAKQHDPERNTLTIEYQGRTLTLAIREAKIVSSGSAAHPMPSPVASAPAPNVSPAVTQSVVVNPTPADEQRRLEAVAAEVARRRALREQAAQQPAPAVPAANVPRAVMPQPVQPGVQGGRSGPAPQPR